MTTICGHCDQALIGYGSVDGLPLCHPDIGLDCFHLVTVYQHPVPCDYPPCAASIAIRRLRESRTVGD